MALCDQSNPASEARQKWWNGAMSMDRIARVTECSLRFPPYLLPLLLATSAMLSFPNTANGQIEGPAIRVTSSLVLVDVISVDKKSALPLHDLKKEDFRVFDDGKEMEIQSFDSGTKYSTRPIALWFLMICNQKNWDNFGSGFMRGKAKLLRPALAHLDKKDTVGVAHWCDDGTSSLDRIPDRNVDGALDKIEQLTNEEAKTPGTRTGELALQKTLRGILDHARQSDPPPLPVVVFLYGDHSGMQRDEIDKILDELLERSVIVFGINNGAVSLSPGFTSNMGNQPNVGNFLAWRAGGAYFAVKPAQFELALDDILVQVHFRYVLGFKPPKLDGKRHELKVVLSPAAKERHPNGQLKARPEYIPGSQ